MHHKRKKRKPHTNLLYTHFANSLYVRSECCCCCCLWCETSTVTGELLMLSKFYFLFSSSTTFAFCCCVAVKNIFHSHSWKVRFYGMKYFILASQEFLCTIIIHVDLQFSRQQLSGTSVLCSKMLFTYIHIPIEEISFYSILSILWNSCVYMYESLSTWYCHNKHFFFFQLLSVLLLLLCFRWVSFYLLKVYSKY